MKISQIIVFAFVFASSAFFAQLNAQNADAQIAQLKQEVASLKSTIKQIEKDYYAYIEQSTSRQAKLRAEIRRLKLELENVSAQKAVKAEPAIFPASEPEKQELKRETYDKDLEYREAQAKRLTREREEAEKKSAKDLKEEKKVSTSPLEEKPKGKSKPSKIDAILAEFEAEIEAEEKEEEKSSFWDSAFPF